MATFTKLAFASCVVVFTMGHGDGCCAGDASVLGPATETECPPSGTTLTYETFGRAFVTDYCVECHDSAKSGTARKGAPAFHDFDTLIGVKQVADHVDQVAGFGPAAMNMSMPPSGDRPFPTDEEREMLAEWIACGAN